MRGEDAFVEYPLQTTGLWYDFKRSEKRPSLWRAHVSSIVCHRRSEIMKELLMVLRGDWTRSCPPCLIHPGCQHTTNRPKATVS